MTETVANDRPPVAKPVSRPRPRKPATVSASALAQHLDCSRTYISKLKAEDVIQHSIARLRGAGDHSLPQLSVAEIQKALAADEAVVAWVWVGKNVLLVVAVDKTRVHAERVILPDDQRALLDRYVEQARAGEGKWPVNMLGATVALLTDAVFPAATRTFVANARRLILSPHRSLDLLPFHAAEVDGQFLIERAAVRYAPNFASLLIPWRGVREGNVIAIGINAFDRDSLPTLKAPEAEARAVAGAWTAHNVPAIALTGAAATRAAFAALPLDRCRCLHLATHGVSVFSSGNNGDPFASRLCFQDGDVEALSVAEWPLRAELVVMSAMSFGGSARSICRT